MRLSFQRLAMVWMIAACSAAFAAEPRHVALFQEEGRFGGWPANGGMWAWGNEILVCYTEADHEDRPGHSYDRATARNMLARSLDGGETWAREDAFAQGITGHAHDHRVGDLGKPPAALDTPIDFTHPGFAFLMQRENNHDGPSHFYYTYDRGKSWSGPFAFPNLDTHGFAARTDYVVDGRRKMVVFLTAAKRDGREGRIAAVRTDDGGMTWQRVAWIGPEPAAGRDFAIMPASVRLSPQKLLTVARHREGGETWLTSYLSEDNARTWQRLADPATGNMNTPPALLRLPDGRLVLAYVFRRSSGEGSSVCVRISSDDGQSWGDQIVLRGSEGANSDVGYPRIVRRPDGKLLIAYYWNHALRNDLPRYRYIAATIWSPGEQKKSGWADDRDNDKVIINRPALNELLARTGAVGGVVVHVGCGDGAETADLAKQGDAYLVQGLDACPESLDRARQRARALGSAGRLSFKQWPGGPLPYTDNLVNVLFWQEPEENADREEILRVLAPHGTAFIRQDADWQELRKPWPDDIDQWSHFRYNAGNTGASQDRRVGPPNHLQWEAGPRFMRSHEIETGLSSIVSTNGRIYYILDEGPIGITDARFPAKWSLLCRDAFNGVLLWKRPMPNWGWRAWNAQRDNTPGSWLATRHHSSADVDRVMVADGDTLYVPLGFGSALSAIDGMTGEVIMTYEQTAGMLECIVLDGVLITRSADPTPAITATRAKDGTMLWRREAGMILDRSLCAAGGRVFFHTRQALIAVDLKTGDELWRHETNLRPAALMAHEDAVLAVQSSLTRAFSAETGEELWQERGAGIRGRNPDIFLVGDHVCWSRGRFEVRHIITGELVKQLDSQNVLSSGHHRRCFVDRATADYLITGQRGSEFLDLHENNHKRHNWLRGPCLTGMMPANGLFYVPPHQCFCYPSVRMDGFFALASNISKGESDIEASEPGNADRLRQGPAYAQALEMAAPSADPWHTYRQNAERSGATRSQVPASLDRLWSTAPGGNLTQPIVAGRKVFVACKDAGTLHCLDFDSGTLLWSRTAAGRIDSPPSYHEGFVIFGSRDGRVYSLRATDGELAWSFRAAPADRQIVSYERLESAWPAHGSVLILDGLVYSSAGRSGFIDGGIDLYALDSVTGRVVHQTKLQGPQPDISQPSYAFHKEGYRADLLTTDGRYLYLGRTALDRNLDIVPTERVHLIGNQRGDELEYQKMPGMRLVATGGFLDETFWNRTWWMYSYVWPGFHFAVQAPKSGQMLVFDDQQTYAVKHYTTRNLHSPMQFPGSGYLLMADDNDNEPLFYRGEGEPKPIEWEIEYPASQRPELNLFGDAAHDKGPGFSRARPARWTSWVDVRVEAMVLANDTLFVAGTPDIVPSDDPLAALEGRMGGVLKIFCAEDGEELAKYPLKSPPVFDGLIAAKGRLLLSTKDGAVICMGQK